MHATSRASIWPLMKRRRHEILHRLVLLSFTPLRPTQSPRMIHQRRKRRSRMCPGKRHAKTNRRTKSPLTRSSAAKLSANPRSLPSRRKYWFPSIQPWLCLRTRALEVTSLTNHVMRQIRVPAGQGLDLYLITLMRKRFPAILSRCRIVARQRRLSPLQASQRSPWSLPVPATPNFARSNVRVLCVHTYSVFPLKVLVSSQYCEPYNRPPIVFNLRSLIAASLVSAFQVARRCPRRTVLRPNVVLWFCRRLTTHFMCFSLNSTRCIRA
mmetsp:Transcript_13181/g.25604  ORF Transcript_13181/g.25604 Transcript_13181/m.25604 type:complete len:268 (+) Transcript_13181:1133-1936(+)